LTLFDKRVYSRSCLSTQCIEATLFNNLIKQSVWALIVDFKIVLRDKIKSISVAHELIH